MVDIEKAVRDWENAKKALEYAKTQRDVAIRQAIQDGASEHALARCGFNRGTVRSALGKPTKKPNNQPTE